MSQTYYNTDKPLSIVQPWSYHRSNQIMRGILPVEFVHINPFSTTEQNKRQNTPTTITLKPNKRNPDACIEDDNVEEDDKRARSAGYDNTKRRSPRFNKNE
jgi:aconitase A